jgi:hypothetical protein
MRATPEWREQNAQSSPSPLWEGSRVGVGHTPSVRRHTPTLLDSTDLADAKSYLASLPTGGRVAD